MTDAADLAVRIAEPDEGFSGPPYLDPAGIPTQGFGAIVDLHGHRVTMQTPPVTRLQAEFMLKRDMSAAVSAVRHAVHVPLTEDEEAALDDFVFNLGCGALLHSTLLRLLNAGDYRGAAAQLDCWDHAGGKVLAGLLRRREQETALFTQGTLPQSQPLTADDLMAEELAGTLDIRAAT